MVFSQIEFLAILYSVNHFRQFLYGREFTIITDHEALQYIKNVKDPGSRLSKLLLQLSEYSYSIKYTSGRFMSVPDALSRAPLETTVSYNFKAVEVHHAGPSNLSSNQLLSIPNVLYMSPDSVNLELVQQQDDFLKEIRLILSGLDSANSKFTRQSRRFVIKDNIFYYKELSNFGLPNFRLALPKCLVHHIIKFYHDVPVAGSHLGISKTVSKIKDKYYWPTLFQDVQDYVRSCPICQIVKKTDNWSTRKALSN